MSLRQLCFLAILLLPACAQHLDKAGLPGSYKLINGPPIHLEIYRDGTGRISNGTESSKFDWSLDDGQIFLNLSPKFLSQLEPLGLSRRQKAFGSGSGMRGYFGLTPNCPSPTNCRLEVNLEGDIYFKKTG